MVKESKYINERFPHFSIDPADEDIVIVCSNGCTRIWVKGKEIDKCESVAFTADVDKFPKLNLQITT